MLHLMIRLLLNDLGWPLMGERRDIKFGGQVSHSKSQPTDDKPSLKESWSRYVTPFNF